MLKTFSLFLTLIKPTRRLSTQKGIAVLTTPRTNNAFVYIFISGQEKSELWIFLKLTSNSVMFHMQFITHGWPFISLFLCNILYWFCNAFAYFRLNRMSRSRKGLWSSGISRIQDIAIFCIVAKTDMMRNFSSFLFVYVRPNRETHLP